MSVVDSFLKKMRMVSDDDYDDYDEYDDYEGEPEEDDVDEDIISQKRVKAKKKYRPDDDFDEFDDFPEDLDEDLSAKAPAKPARSSSKNARAQKADPGYSGITQLRSVRKDDGNMNNVCMIMPKGFEDANLIVDKLTEGCGVVMNLEGIDMSAAQRIIDFASGACYALNGNLQRISKKIFMAVPGDVNLSGDFDDLIDDMVGLNSVSMK